jgi:hypothetical protein
MHFMRNPHRKRNIAVGTTLFSLLMLAVAVQFHNPETNTLFTIVGIVGFTCAILGIAFSINAQFETVRYNRLMRGEDVLVRWLVDPHRWRDFLKLNEHLNSQPGNLNCPITDANKGELRSEGIKVVICKAALMIDDDFHSLPVNGFTTINGPWWFEGPPPYLEFRLSSRSKSTTFHWALRIPVPAGAEGDARLVYDYYQSRSAR